MAQNIVYSLFLLKSQSVILYTILLFLICFLALRYVKSLRPSSLNPWLVLTAFSLKVAIGFYFLYLYTLVYGDGTLSADAGAFMEESKALNRIFYQSPADYLKLLTGLGDNQTLILHYLEETSHWDAGAQAIISDNRNILRLHSLIHFFSFGNAAIHVFVMCFLSIIGLNQLFIALKDRTNLKLVYLFLLLLLFPSVLFWTSGILKEPLMFLGFSLLARSIFGKDNPRKKVILCCLGVLLLIGFKPYVIIAFLPAILFYGLYRLMPRLKIISAISVLIIIFLSIVIFLPGIRDRVTHIFSMKQYDFKNVAKGGLHALNMQDSSFYYFEAEQFDLLTIEEDSVSIKIELDAVILRHGAMEFPQKIHLKPSNEKWLIYFTNKKSDGYIELTMIKGSFTQMIKNIPEALINSLFRPFFNDPGSWLKYPAMIETVLLFFFLIYAVVKRRKLSVNEKVLILSIVLFVLTLSLIIGWVTPVLGAIVRYRIPAYLGILIIALLIINPVKKIKHE